MLVKTFAGALFGIDVEAIEIEVNVTSPGIGFFLVGLPDNAVKESQKRIESALQENGYRLPGKQIIINMAPADIKKEGSSYDLSLAIAILAASEQIPYEKVSRYFIMGELALDGTIRPLKGALPLAIKAQKMGLQGFILPEENGHEAAIVNNLDVLPVKHISEVIDFFNGDRELTPLRLDTRKLFAQEIDNILLDFSDVKGQESVKRAMEIAAAGGHNIIMIGPPGAGKTMLAKRMPFIMPPFSLHEALETTKIHSVSGRLGSNTSLMTERPFRAPHHTISDVALVGGGSYPQPGEISLAHHGVLFLDELPEFKRPVLEVLRQPLEERRVTISRAQTTVDYPAGFILIASMNPCPCGYYNHPQKECHCSPMMIEKYTNKISGPLMDRIDIQMEVVPVPVEKLTDQTIESEKSIDVRKRVIKAREKQLERFKNLEGVFCNTQMESKELRQYCQLGEESVELLKRAIETLGLSARAHDRIIRIARTIADMDDSEDIQKEHILQAINYRRMDRANWGK